MWASTIGRRASVSPATGPAPTWLPTGSGATCASTATSCSSPTLRASASWSSSVPDTSAGCNTTSRAIPTSACASSPSSPGNLDHRGTRTIPSLSVVGLLQRRNVDLLHLQHGLHDALRFDRILVAQHLVQNHRRHLPWDAVFVFEPSALDDLSAPGELV